MIWESEYWKEDLVRKSSELRQRKLQSRWPEASHAKLEQLLMLGFYSIRKLHEANKLSQQTTQEQLGLTAFPWSGKNVTKLNWHKLDQLYNLEAGVSLSKDVLFVCHQFVHSYVFMAQFDEHDRLDGILFASDRQRHQALLQISIDQIADLFSRVGNDYPSAVRFTFNENTRDYDFTDIVSDHAVASDTVTGDTSPKSISTGNEELEELNP